MDTHEIEHDFAVEVVYDNDQHKHFVVLRDKADEAGEVLFVIDPYDAMKLGSSINNCGIIAQVLSTPQPHEHVQNAPMQLNTIGARPQTISPERAKEIADDFMSQLPELDPRKAPFDIKKHKQ